MLNSIHELTVDGKHQQICNKHQRTRTKTIPRLRAEMGKLQQDMAKESTSMDKILEMKDRCSDIKKQIKRFKKEENDYYLTNSSMVHEYFESKKNIGSGENKATILDKFFNKGDAEEDSDTTKQSIANKYFSNVDERCIDLDNFVFSKDVCRACFKGELIHVAQDGVLICDHCSNSVVYVIDNDKPSYKEPPKEVTFYAYKRINHFREVLAQFQAKQSTQIPDEVIENIRTQIKKERITVQQIDNKKAKEILKKMGYNKYYEHIPFIKDKLGIKPPVMSPQLEETLCSMFMKIQAPYAKFCPSSRVNFLNYYYTVYKLCELLDQRQFLPFFPMLKDREKRIEQDEIWRNICGELDWEFIPTV